MTTQDTVNTMTSKIKHRKQWTNKVFGFLVLVLLQYPRVTAVTGVLDIHRISGSRRPYSYIRYPVDSNLLRRPKEERSFGTVLQQPLRRRAGSQLGHVAESFASVELLSLPDDVKKDIRIDQLLYALQQFHTLLKRTAPSAVTRDFYNNLLKAESAYREYQSRHQHESGHHVTLTSLLRHERVSGIHQAGDQAVLSDPSGAMGLLWIRRSLAFQADLYESIARGADCKDAAMLAYEQQLHPYHGWTLRKLFRAAGVHRMPPRHELLARMGGYDGDLFRFATLRRASDPRRSEAYSVLMETFDRPLEGEICGAGYGGCATRIT